RADCDRRQPELVVVRPPLAWKRHGNVSPDTEREQHQPLTARPVDRVVDRAGEREDREGRQERENGEGPVGEEAVDQIGHDGLRRVSVFGPEVSGIVAIVGEDGLIEVIEVAARGEVYRGAEPRDRSETTDEQTVAQRAPAGTARPGRD